MSKHIHQHARAHAEHFIAEETQFHLGNMPTEQPHVYTRDFSSTIQKDAVAGISLLLAVDGDIPAAARRAVLSPEYDALVCALQDAAVSGRRVCFSGCGSTGRLSVMLEEMWRQYWEDAAGMSAGGTVKGEAATTATTATAELACSIITGGDRALIRSVENFEDYQQFGERQLAELHMSAGDVLVAITEGGETSSVIGTVHEALRRDMQVFLVYNNPTELLTQHIERSRVLIENPKVCCIDLCTGQMALSGSTRMQATTIEMLIIGAALEEALLNAAKTVCSESKTDNMVSAESLTKSDVLAARLRRVEQFAALLHTLKDKQNVNMLAGLAAHEASIYRQGGRITYFADSFLLDVFSDTTERTPTFALPPFRPADDKHGPVSWAFAKNPLHSSREAWRAMLRRAPRGLSWKAEDYRAMGVPKLADAPPLLNEQEIDRYIIGNEIDETRAAAHPSLYVSVYAGGNIFALPNEYQSNGAHSADEYAAVYIDIQNLPVTEAAHDTADGAENDTVYCFTLAVPNSYSPIYLWHHLAVKLIFNTISTASMGMMGRIQGNWMTQVEPTNKKLIDRGSRIIAQLCNVSYAAACEELYAVILEHHRLKAHSTPSQQERIDTAQQSPVVEAIERLTARERT